MAKQDIEINIRNQGPVSIIDIKGDVTALTGGTIEGAYRKLTPDAKKILLHFGAQSYINSGGIAFLIGIVSESRKNQQIIRITGLSAHFQKIFSMVGLTKYAQLFDSEEAALENF